MTNQQASDAGKLLGQQQDALITPQINQANANANIKHLTPNPAETQFFGGGKADNFSPGDAKRIACDTGPKNPDAFAQQSCDAINLVAKAPKQRPAYTVDRNAPMLQREQAVRANASTVATAGVNPANNPNGFGLAGTYSACTTTTTPDPATTETKLCTDYMTATQTTTTNNCQKSVNTTQSCHQVMSFTVTQGTVIPAAGNTYIIPPSACAKNAAAPVWSFSCNADGTVSIASLYGSATFDSICSGPAPFLAGQLSIYHVPGKCALDSETNGPITDVMDSAFIWYGIHMSI